MSFQRRTSAQSARLSGSHLDPRTSTGTHNTMASTARDVGPPKKRPTSFLKRLRSLGRDSEVPSGLVISWPVENAPTSPASPVSPLTPPLSPSSVNSLSPASSSSPASLFSQMTPMPMTPMTPFTPMPPTPKAATDLSPELIPNSRRVPRKPVPSALYRTDEENDPHHQVTASESLSGLYLSLPDSYEEFLPTDSNMTPMPTTSSTQSRNYWFAEGYASDDEEGQDFPTYARRGAIISSPNLAQLSPSIYSQASPRHARKRSDELADKTPDIPITLWAVPHPLSHSRQSSFSLPRSRRGSQSQEPSDIADDRSDASSLCSSFDREQQEVDMEAVGGTLTSLIQTYDLCDRPRASFSEATSASSRRQSMLIESRRQSMLVESNSRRQSLLVGDGGGSQDVTPRGSLLRPIAIPVEWTED